MTSESKIFVQLFPYNVKVLWFSASRSHLIIYKGVTEDEDEMYYHVPGTGVIIAHNCWEEVKQIFLEMTNQELIQEGVLPQCSNTIPAAIRKYLKSTEIPEAKSPSIQEELASPSLDTSLRQFDRATSVTKHILVVDDDSNTRDLVTRTLTMEGYKVNTAVSGEAGLEFISRFGLPHLALVDINMPGMNGIELCQRLLDFSDLPIIMLTAQGDEETIAHVIDEYTEDYMVKPISLRELVARVGRVLRRTGDFAYKLSPLIQVDDYLTIDLYGQNVIVNDEAISLTPRETKVIYILMRNAGQIVTKDFLMRRIWAESANEDFLPVFIYRIRQKIERDPKNPYYISSVRGVGYQFVKP